MAEYITKQEAVKAVGFYSLHSGDKLLFADEALKAIPPADVWPVVRGRWERTEGDSRFMCSVCKGKEYVPTIMGEPIVWDYCPNCGADMREGGADDDEE